MVEGFPVEAGRISLYVRVANSLRNRIGLSEWSAGERIPTIDRLAAEYGVSRVTIRQAVSLLANDGMVVSSRGRGTFVSEARAVAEPREIFPSSMDARLDLTEAQSVHVLWERRIDTIPSPFLPVEAAFESYVMIRKIHLHNDEPFAFIDAVVATEVFNRFPHRAIENKKLIRLVIDHGGIPVRVGRQEITVTHADALVAEALHCQITSPLVKIRSWRSDPLNRLLLSTVSLYRGDRFIYDVVDIGEDMERSRTFVIPDSKL